LSNHRVLITEGYNPVSVPIMRSLGKQNIDISVTTNSPMSISCFSKYCKNQYIVPSIVHEKEYSSAVAKIVKKFKFELLVPVFEESLLPISKNRDSISSHTNLPLASHASILSCIDKLSTMKLAIENGVPIPKTYFVKNSTELKSISEKVNYPAVVKPRWSMIWKGDRIFHRRGGFVNSPPELVATYNSIHPYFPYPLIQEYVPGINYSVAALYNKGKPRAFCCIKVQRAWPPTGGNSCFRESVQLDTQMKEYSEKMLEALDWHGIAEVEFRFDQRDNVPKLMEINPRFWGSLCVAINAGVDFPYLLYQMTMNGDINSVTKYKTGIKGRYFQQDLLYIIRIFKEGFVNQSNCSQKKLKLLLYWLKFYEPGIFYDLFEMDDPLPFFFNSALFLKDLAKFLKEKTYAWSPPQERF
jgi:predicted ATP-grasp superfamily ATP-dependent carboligase